MISSRIILLILIVAATARVPALAAEKPLKIVCVGAHPDDPESGCGGTLARYAALGHSVTVIYFTRGERGIKKSPLDEAARVRTAEAEAACKLLGAKAVFAGQIDGATELNKARVDDFTKLLAAEAPDIVFTHWPIDTHLDHQIASVMAQRASDALPKRPQLYYFEVNTGSQSRGFTPNTYVDITSVVEQKKSALFAHTSQDGERIWREHHEPMAKFRGREAGAEWAEAFVHLNRDNKSGALPGLGAPTNERP
ncbi:MAG TPA: PIG-L deacetylase family protein [Planctomycetota bacterium]|nr:PIG-L deacetylase family protein [Planctomycetota bacterium]